VETKAKKWLPWNWFRKEEEHEEASFPVAFDRDDPLWSLHKEIDRLFAGAWPRAARRSQRPTESVLKPSLDIRESGKAYTLALEVPGVDAGDVHVELEDRTLIITGEKKHESEEDDETYHCVERTYGAFRRILSLPDDADEQGIDAKFRRGVLTIRVPRRQRPDRERGRVIPVS
jgi:HSP20 family protein